MQTESEHHTTSMVRKRREIRTVIIEMPVKNTVLSLIIAQGHGKLAVYAGSEITIKLAIRVPAAMLTNISRIDPVFEHRS